MWLFRENWTEEIVALEIYQQGNIGRSRDDLGVYDIVAPGNVSDKLSVSADVPAPVWAGGQCLCDPPVAKATLWSTEQLVKLRRACHLAAKILSATAALAVPGTSTDQLDQLAHRLCVENGAYPSPLNYRHFPKSICTSVNNVACHGVPDDRPLVSGDLISIDVSVFLDGFHGDCSATYCVGDVDHAGRELVKMARRCRDEAIAACAPNSPINTIGEIVERLAVSNGYSIVDAFIGHGIGSYFHGPPDIYHVTNNVTDPMTPGMTFTIEPVVSQGGSDIVVLDDGWTAVTTDGARCAQFEHTILITDSGVEILTL